jgi:hypothetical protein
MAEQRFRTLEDLYATFPEDLREVVRITAALTGFRQQYRHWPSRVRLDQEHHQGLASQLTRAAFVALEQKVSLIPEADLCDVVAEDEAGNCWFYGSNPIPASTDEASRWIWGIGS